MPSCSVMSDSCDPVDCSLPGSSVRGILQVRILEWVAISGNCVRPPALHPSRVDVDTEWLGSARCGEGAR